MTTHVDAIILGAMMLVLGSLLTAFFALIWKRLDSIDTRLGVIDGDLKQFYSLTGELKGRIDEIGHHLK